MRRIFFNEVVTRDGFQNEPAFVPTEAKQVLIDELSACGYAKIEVTSFTSARAIPMLRDADELCKHPEMLEMLPLSVRSAAWYWDSRDLNALADAGKFDLITKAINGGYNGMADRQAYHARAQKALASSEDAAGPVPFPNKKPNLFQRIAQWFRS